MRSAALAVVATVWLVLIGATTWLPQPFAVLVVLVLVTGLARYLYAQGILTGHDMDRASAFPPAQWWEWGASPGPDAPGLPGGAPRNERHSRWPLLPPPGGTAPPGEGH
jgi:hypothetical protein